MPSILCIHQGFELYGSDRSFIRSVKAIRELYPNSRITAVLPQKGPLSKYLTPFVNSLKIIPLGILRKSDFTNFRVNNIIRLFSGIIPAWKLMKQYDLIYINSIVVINCILMARFVKAPSIIHIREITTGWTANFFSRALSWSHAHLIFNSNATKAAYSIRSDCRKTIIYNGITGFPNLQTQTVPGKKTNILLIGRLNSMKGQTLLLQALGIINEKTKKKLSVRIVGDYFEGQKHFLDELILLRQNLQMESLVDIFPFSESPEAHYQWADIITVPSTKPESFGLVAIEGMSAGKPVIAADHGGLSEIIIHEKTGILFEPLNKHALADAIQLFIDTPGLLQEYGASGKDRFNELFHENNYSDALKKVISETII